MITDSIIVMILFPVPDKTKIVNWFISQAKNLKNDADE